MRLQVSVIAALVLLANCAAAQQRPTAHRSEAILLRVLNAADNATRIPGAEVFAVKDQGALGRIGVTDVNGYIKVPRSALTTSGNAVAVVVCHPVFFCGAQRVEDLAPRDEATLALAPYVSD